MNDCLLKKCLHAYKNQFKDFFSLQAKLRKTRDRGERQQVKTDLKFLRKELRQREDSAMADLLKRADIVLATLTSAGTDGPLRHLTREHFDMTVIDECSQVYLYVLTYSKT